MVSEFSRRSFLKNSSKAIAVASVSPAIIGCNSVGSSVALEERAMNLGDYYAKFGVDEELIAKIININFLYLI